MLRGRFQPRDNLILHLFSGDRGLTPRSRLIDQKPHLSDGFKMSNDPLFVGKVYDVVGLYLNPPESAVVL